MSAVLIVSSVPADVQHLTRALAKARDGPFEVAAAGSLAAGLARLALGGIDAILVDLALPDSQGLASFERLHAAARQIPIVTLCASDDEAEAIEAVQRGAQSYLSKGYFDNALLPQALRNIIQRKAVEEKLYLAQARAGITLESIGDAVLSTNTGGRIDYLNAAAERMTGWRREEACGRPSAEVLQIMDGVTRVPAANPLDAVLAQDAPVALHAGSILKRRDGAEIPIEDSAAPIHDREGRIAGAVLVFRDISRVMALSMKMRHQAEHDALTNLPNRMLLHDRIEQAIALAGRHRRQVALLFMDLDRFKYINDSMGHAVGDQLLQSVAARLSACVRLADTVSRQGGDEFVVLLAEDLLPEDAAVAAEKILLALDAPHMIDGRALHATASIGISIYPDDGADAQSLIKNADTAMYHAKERGCNNYQFFREEMNVRVVERQLIESQLRLALARQEFALHYQPKVDLRSGRISGVEALLRWRHPEWGWILPQRFIATAEDCGLIVPIGRWALAEACAQAVHWQRAGLAPVSLAVNISSLEFRSRDFFEHMRAIVHASGADPRSLQLELTESVLMHDVLASAALLDQIKALGVQIAVDDFGTGYSSLSYLSRLPIDVLKIDQSFVQAIGRGGASDGVIVSAVIGMGNSLHQRVVAEGVEDAAQLAFLQTQHCAEAQGFLFSRPVSADAMGKLLAAGVCP